MENILALLGVICRIGKKPQIKLATDAIGACNDDTMLVHFKKLVIEKNFPLGMHNLAAAVCDESLAGPRFPRMLSCKILKCVWKLQMGSEAGPAERCKWQTVWKYATWLLKLHVGLLLRYLDSFQKLR
jgi:hypothetical protein